jgi:outer membrane protein TolC
MNATNHMRIICFFGALVTVLALPSSGTAQELKFYETKEYEEVISRALAVSPQTKALKASIKAIESDVRTAHLGTQSEIEFEMEEFGLDGSSVSDSEMTLMWAKEIEPKNLRNERISLSERLLHEKKALFQNELLGFVSEVSQAWFEVAGKRMELTLAEETVALAQEMLTVAKNRVNTGAAPGLEEERSQMEYDLALINEGRAKNDLNGALAKLGSYLQLTNKEMVVPELKYPITATTELDILEGKDLDNHPLIEAATLAIERAKSEELVTSYEGKTPFKTMAGFRHVGETSDSSFVLGFAIPLGTGRRNQSKREAAKWAVKEEENRLKEQQIELARNQEQAILLVKAAKAEFSSVENLLLPSVKRIFNSVKEGYLRGELKYTDLLVAKQSLVDVASQRVSALLNLRLALLELDIANGGSQSMKDAVSEVLK